MARTRRPPASAGYRVESVVRIDARGQLVLPKDVRERAGFRAGDRLALISWESGGKVQGVSIMKVEVLTELVRSTLGPLMGEVGRKEG
jgi:AbrB family looped-hinge helix DNA binding protein